MKINVPAQKNKKLAQIVDLVGRDAEIEQLYKCVNMNAVDRIGMPDHGPVHIRIVVNIALRIARLLHKGGVTTNIEKDYDMSYLDAEVIVFLGALLHDVGISVHREKHETFSIPLAATILDKLLPHVYSAVESIIIRSEVLHAIIAHHSETECYTIEAGVVKVADALDMSEGRSRISFEAGEINIYSVSSAAIENIELTKGEEKPVRIEIKMTNSAGIFQIDELLKRKLNNSSIRDLVEIVANIEGEKEKKIVSMYEM